MKETSIPIKPWGRPAEIALRLANLTHNVQVIRTLCPGRQIIAMVKANGYGHGILEVARALENSSIDCLGVASIDEAIALRKAGISSPILLMEGIFHPQELAWVIELQLSLVVHSKRQVDFLQQQLGESGAYILPVWLKVDIGMHRLGVSPSAVAELKKRLQAHRGIDLQGLMGHFSHADEINNPLTLKQMITLVEVADNHERISLANSAAILGWPAAHGEVVRPGIMLYGLSPFSNSIGKDFNLKPVMDFTSQVIAIQHVLAGETVGYGGTWQAMQDSVIAIIAAGYGDGYPRHAQNGTPVWVAGKIVPLVGRVSMDMIAVDITAHSKILVGAPAVLWGDVLPAEQVALHCGTIAYELVSGIATRVPTIAGERMEAESVVQISS